METRKEHQDQIGRWHHLELAFEDFSRFQQIKKIVTYINLIYSLKNKNKEDVTITNSNNSTIFTTSNATYINLKNNPPAKPENLIFLNLALKKDNFKEDTKNLIKA